MNEKNFKIDYRGSLPWLIFWIIIFFPIALVLFFTAADFNKDGVIHRLNYNGSRGWLCFWILFFFPLAFILFFLNGFSVEKLPR